MDNLDKGDVLLFPVTTSKIYDISRAESKLSSNVLIKFEIISDVSLPQNTKIEIIETELEYVFRKINKNIHINGHKISELSNSLEDIVCMKDKYINLVDNSCASLVLNITESLMLDVDIKIKVRGIAYINNCSKVCFDAVGVGKDSLNSIIVSNIYVPNTCKFMNNGFLKIKNDIVGLCNPEYIFLSPLYDCCGCIEFLMGNMFINYCANLNVSSQVSEDLYLLSYI